MIAILRIIFMIESLRYEVFTKRYKGYNSYWIEELGSLQIIYIYFFIFFILRGVTSKVTINAFVLSSLHHALWYIILDNRQWTIPHPPLPHPMEQSAAVWIRPVILISLLSPHYVLLVPLDSQMLLSIIISHPLCCPHWLFGCTLATLVFLSLFCFLICTPMGILIEVIMVSIHESAVILSRVMVDLSIIHL